MRAAVQWLVLALLIAAALAGCDSRGARAGKPIVLGFSQSGSSTAWREANSASIQAAAEEAGIDLKFSNAQLSQESQIAALRDFIAQKVDVIAFSPVVETGWDDVLNEAKKAGIPVLLAERAVKANGRLLYATVVAPDFVEEGRNAARWLRDYKLGRIGRTHIVELRGPPDSLTSNERAHGFREVFESEPHFQIIGSESGEPTREEGQRLMKAFIKAEGRRINVVFSHNDEMTLGAIRAMEEARMKPGKDIIVISIEGTKAAFEAMLAGKLNLAVECNPLYGPQIMGVARDLVAHRRLPHRLAVEEYSYPMEMAREILPTRKY